MGMDLYGALIVMLAWGDRWLSRGGPPIILTHRDCGNDSRRPWSAIIAESRSRRMPCATA